MNQRGRKNGGREGWKEEEEGERNYVGRKDGKKGWSEGGGKEGP